MKLKIKNKIGSFFKIQLYNLGLNIERKTKSSDIKNFLTVKQISKILKDNYLDIEDNIL